RSTGDDLPVDDEGRAATGAEGDRQHAAGADPGAVVYLAQRESRGVVEEGDPHTLQPRQLFFEQWYEFETVHLLELRQTLDEEAPALFVEGPRHGHRDADQLSGTAPVQPVERGGQLRDHHLGGRARVQPPLVGTPAAAAGVD